MSIDDLIGYWSQDNDADYSEDDDFD